MIFVTVGTSPDGHLQLVKAIDSIAPAFPDKIVVQIGGTNYTPKNCESFKFANSLFPYFEKADLVITSGGVGTLFELLYSDKKIIGVSNLDMPNQHQDDILNKLSEKGYIYWCKDFGQLKEYIQKAKSERLKKYQNDPCNIADGVLNYLDKTLLSAKKNKAVFNR